MNYSGPTKLSWLVNLTVLVAHAEITVAALHAGKHVLSEKPLATPRADGRRILEAAASNGREIGCAPDVFLGAGDARTEWLVVEQDEPRRDPMESVPISYANLSKLAAEVGLEA